ncbi:UNVERIFIED_CONTAM: hypothetical protein HDU68_005404 [Siphonaria sp. JEL0065]|nr:hypothetical protein HDU68_005404 [Siphonaria sp. JEL0065]
MIAKILEINQKRGDEDCQLDSMVYGVCVKVPEKGLPSSGIKRRRSNNDRLNAAISTSTSMVDKDEVTVVRPAASSSSASISSSASTSYCATPFANTACAGFGRSVFSSGASCPNLPSTYSSAPPSPWIIPCHTRVGCTSEYMDFGTALKLRSIRPIFDQPPPDHDPSTPDACRSGVSLVTPVVGEVPAQPTPMPTGGRTSSSSSTDTTNSSEYDYDDEDDEMDIDEDEEWGSQESGDEEIPFRPHSQLTNGSRRSSNRPNSSASHPAAPRSSPLRAATTASPLPFLPNHQHQQTQNQQQLRTSATTAIPSRYLVDGIGTWRFKVLERGVCDDGLNLALVERLEDMDFEDEECAGLDVVNAALAEKEDAANNPLRQPAEVCTMAECDCATSKKAKASAFATSISQTMDTMSTTKYQNTSSMDYTHELTVQLPKAKSRCTTSSTSMTATTPTPDTDNNYTCPMSEFFKSTHLSSFAKCMYSGVQYLACTKQPLFPFDIYEVAPSKPHEATTTTNLAYSQTQNEYLQSLYTRLSNLVQEITTHLNTAFLHQQESTGTTSITTAYANALHFKLIHGDVPSCIPNTASEAAEHLTYWVANLLDLSEVSKNEILRHDLGGVDGRVEWVLGVVAEMKRVRCADGGEVKIGDLLKVKF